PVERAVERGLASEILANGDIFHLGSDDASPRIMHLGDIGAGLGAKNPLADVGERLDAAAAVRPELAIVLGADVALDDFLDIAASVDPVVTKLSEAGHDVDPPRWIGVGAARVVKDNRRFSGRGLEIDGAHCDADAVVPLDMDLARAADRPGGDFEFGSCR